MNRLIIFGCCFVLMAAASAQTWPPAPVSGPRTGPENLGLGLRQLAELHLQDQRQVRNTIDSSRSIMSDASGRVVVNIHLNGKMPLSVVMTELVALGSQIIASDASWQHGVISARLPVSEAITAANITGVQSIMLARRPVRRIGAVTAESSVVQHALEVNTPGVITAQGILGRGITVGLVSDSFDTAAGSPRASVGIASGDLPGPGNPNGYTQPVFVLKDDGDPFDADEGRAMAEIVHDIAPAARLAFSASGPTQVTMANSIRTLRTSSATFCDVIVDDIGFAEEPFFSDGIIAQAVDDVVTSNTLPGKKVAYFSAAGNSSNRGYDAEANIISAAASTPYRGNLRFTGVPADTYAGGFQNFNPGGPPVIAMPVTTDENGGAQIIFQWDDPFVAGGITTDYNLLVFSQTGAYLGSTSGIDNSFFTGQPLEFVELDPGSYQLVIGVRSQGANARHLRFIPFAGGTITGPYLSNHVITIYGHAAAANANAVAAYVYNNAPDTVANYNPAKANPPPGSYEPAFEDFSSRGGSLPIYFNAQNQRLASPEIRLKPDFAAADGVDTTFFPPEPGSDYDNNGFPNFFGTSAAAPNAAGFAALMLEAAGGPNSLSPAQVRSTLVQSALPHDLDPYSASATAAAGTALIQMTATGDDSNESATSPNFFYVIFHGQSGETLNQLTIDLGNTPLVFDQQADLGFPFTVGQNNGGVSITPTLSPDRRILTLSFGNSFTPGKNITFGIDRDLAAISAGGNSADLIAGASIGAVVGSSQTAFGAFANQLGAGFLSTDGHGFVDARTAVESIVGKKPGASGIPANLSTRGNVGAGENVLIGGFIIQGTVPKKVIVRAIGPSIPVTGALADPTLELFDGNGVKFAENNDWQDDQDQAAQIEATTIPPTDSKESARVDSLNPGGYTAIVRGANNTTGVALVEVYDLDAQPAASRLANIATRGTVQTGDNVMIGGFILNNSSTQIVVRAIGPSLTAAGVSGVLADPALELRDAQGNLVLGNDNWQQNAFQAVQIQAIGLAPGNALESALTTSLNPGPYTTIVRGARGTTGVALVEVYDLQ